MQTRQNFSFSDYYRMHKNYAYYAGMVLPTYYATNYASIISAGLPSASFATDTHIGANYLKMCAVLNKSYFRYCQLT